MWVHRLSNVNLDTKTADCSNCGPVNIKKSPAMATARCAKAVYANKKKHFAGRHPERAPRCEICGTECLTVFDHNHATNEFRGWLCHKCNLGLGYFQDDTELLRKAAEYLVNS